MVVDYLEFTWVISFILEVLRGASNVRSFDSEAGNIFLSTAAGAFLRQKAIKMNKKYVFYLNKKYGGPEGPL